MSTELERQAAALRRFSIERAVNAVVPAPCAEHRIIPALHRALLIATDELRRAK